MNFPAVLELSFGEVFLLLSDKVKYSILGICVFLLAVTIGILLWQVVRCCRQTPRPCQSVDGLVCAEDRCSKAGVMSKDIQRPYFKVRVVEQEPCHMSYFPGTSKWEQSIPEPNGRAEETQETPPVQGSLLFSVFYDQTRSRLVLTVLEARGLPTRDFSHSVDPFVRVRLLWEGRPPPLLRCVLHEWQTHIVKNSNSPIFRDQFSCSLAEDEVSRVTVRLEVRDFDKYSRHGILGEVRVPLSGLSIAYPLEILENLQEPKKDQVGEALLSLKFLPTSQRLEVGLLKIRMLSVCSTKDKAMYARICVLCNQRKIRHQRTTLKTRRDVTVFNEVMTFVLPDLQVTDCSVIVSFYEVLTSRRSSKQMIGQVALGNGCGSEGEHWNLMMRSLRQPIAKWHFVLI